MATFASNRKIDRREVLKMAWALMGSTYGWRADGRGVPFRSIGRKCLGWCVREAWRQVKETAAFAAMSVAELASRISVARSEIAIAQYADSCRQWRLDEARPAAELARLIKTAAAVGLRIN